MKLVIKKLYLTVSDKIGLKIIELLKHQLDSETEHELNHAVKELDKKSAELSATIREK